MCSSVWIIITLGGSAERKEKEKLNNFDKKRKLEYPKIEELVVAMWEKLIEKKTLAESGVKEIQNLREKIKTDLKIFFLLLC